MTGRLDGPQFVSFRIEVRASSPTADELAKLAESAKRVCYVTRTLSAEPKIEVVVS
ncbi:OsmC family protein [Pseudonocardia sp.]|uniref:OsmC family protein n=1 Tax=Pseudonocardia sp. TaxID=60912 RepID=UPI0039C8C331